MIAQTARQIAITSICENLDQYTKRALIDIEANSRKGRTTDFFHIYRHEIDYTQSDAKHQEWRFAMYDTKAKLMALGYKCEIDVELNVCPFAIKIDWTNAEIVTTMALHQQIHKQQVKP